MQAVIYLQILPKFPFLDKRIVGGNWVLGGDAAGRTKKKARRQGRRAKNRWSWNGESNPGPRHYE